MKKCKSCWLYKNGSCSVGERSCTKKMGISVALMTNAADEIADLLEKEIDR